MLSENTFLMKDKKDDHLRDRLFSYGGERGI